MVLDALDNCAYNPSVRFYPWFSAARLTTQLLCTPNTREVVVFQLGHLFFLVWDQCVGYLCYVRRVKRKKTGWLRTILSGAIHNCSKVRFRFLFSFSVRVAGCCRFLSP